MRCGLSFRVCVGRMVGSYRETHRATWLGSVPVQPPRRGRPVRSWTTPAAAVPGFGPAAAQRCSPGSKLANNRNFDYSENTFVYYFLKEKCLEHPKALCSAIFLLA